MYEKPADVGRSRKIKRHSCRRAAHKNSRSDGYFGSKNLYQETVQGKEALKEGREERGPFKNGNMMYTIHKIGYTITLPRSSMDAHTTERRLYQLGRKTKI
jgi:hypothetical protein